MPKLDLSKINIGLILCLATLIIYWPYLLNPDTLLNRSNDLQEAFYPVFYFMHHQLMTNHTLPLYNNLIFAGTPLLPDPQFSFFYPPNLLLILLPTDIAFFLFFLGHTFFAGLAFYLLLLKGFNFSKPISLYLSLLFLFTPRLAGFLEAGHYGLAASLTWLPLTFLSSILLVKNPTIFKAIFISLSLSGLFFTHSIIFAIGLVSSATLILAGLIYLKSNQIFKTCLLFTISILFTFGLTAANLIPQVLWLPTTSRSLLQTLPDVYPKWTSVKEFLMVILFPWLLNITSLQKLDGEKWLNHGVVLNLLALIGFIRVHWQIKVAILSFGLLVTLVTLNNSSPIYSWLISQNWFGIMRVSTRGWILINIIILILAGTGISSLIHSKLRWLLIPLLIMILVETLSLSSIRISTPVKSNPYPVPTSFIQIIASDHDHFRTYCSTHCISQKTAAFYNIELIDGYNTLVQRNFNEAAWQLTGGYWNYYSLTIPPIGLSTFDQPQPDPKSLGTFNTKYLVSPYPLTNSNLTLRSQTDHFYLYTNNLYLPRAYFVDQDRNFVSDANIVTFQPNYIKIDVSNPQSNRLILSEVFTPGWRAYLNGTTESSVLETPNRLRLIELDNATDFVEFKYQPPGLKIGIITTTLTSLLILAIITPKILALISKMQRILNQL